MYFHKDYSHGNAAVCLYADGLIKVYNVDTGKETSELRIDNRGIK